MAEKEKKAKKTSKKSTKKEKGTLVIVESPTKAKSIEHYLGAGYTVKASVGHVIDLPKSRLAIDVENNFQPEFSTQAKWNKIVERWIKTF